MIALIHIKKTAGKTLKHIMRCEFGVAHCDVKRWSNDADVFSAADLRRLLRINPWLKSIAGHSVRCTSDLHDVFPELRYYTFLRDPIKRTVSQYQYSVAQGRCREGTFFDWIQREEFRNVQTQILSGTTDADAAIAALQEKVAFVGLMERFDESIALMQGLLDLPHFTPLQKRVNAASNNRIRDELLADSQALAALKQANDADTRVFDYVWHELYPRQRRSASKVQVGVDGKAGVGTAKRQYNSRFVANGVYRYLCYKPAVAAWRTFAS